MNCGLIYRLFSSSTSTAKTRSSIPSPATIPIPHSSLPDLRPQDLDFVAIAHSHIHHSDWPRLTALTPLRANHLLLKVHRDPILSVGLYNRILIQNPSSQSLDTHAIILHILTKSRTFISAESLQHKTLIAQTLTSSSDLFDAILHSYCLCDSKSRTFISAESLQHKTLIAQTLTSSSDLFDAILHSYCLCDSTPNVFDSLFKTYARLKKFHNATEMFHKMRDYSFLPTIRSCNAFLSSLLNHDRNDIVISFYREMKRCKISPNVFTLNMVLYALCGLGRLVLCSVD